MRVWGRRDFLAAVGSVCGVLKGAALGSRYSALGEGHSTGARQLGTIGIQLYTVRDDLRRDPEGTLVKIAAIGYKEVEFAGYPMSSVKALRALLDRLGLSAPSGHVDVRAMREDWTRTLEAAAELGQHYVACAGLPAEERQTLDQYRRFGALFDRAGEAARQAGLQLCYHNHDFEFTHIEGRLPFDVLLEATDPRLVQLELDLYWITKGDQDPLAYFRRYPGRFPLVHVKDMDRSAARGFTEVGRGVINFKRIFARAEEAGIRHYFYEQDSTPGSPFESARVSYEYLRKVQF